MVGKMIMWKRILEMKYEIKNEDIRDILIYSFRYCLGRKTYAVSTMIYVLTDNIKIFSNHDLGLYIKEIKEADDDNFLGDEFDKRGWLNLRDLMIKELEKRNN
jgi:hypothetical protein